MKNQSRGSWNRLPRWPAWPPLVVLCLIASLAHSETFVVEEATDTALRNAVIQANETLGLDRIEFADDVDSILITEGQIEIFDSLEIVGRAGAPVTLSGNGSSRILAVIDPGESFPTLDLVHMIIEGGATTQPGTVVINDLGQPDCSTSTGDGGAICSEFLVRLNDVIVRNSQTSGAAADGGGIWAAEGVELVFSSILNNRVVADSLGAGIHDQNGQIICDSSNISGNVGMATESRGGGIAGLDFFATNCLISNNEAGGGAGVFAAFVDLFASTVEGNTAQLRGGGILASSLFDPQTEFSVSSLIVVNSTISGNQAGEGGGIFKIAGDQVIFEIANSTITENIAPTVGGVEVLDPFTRFFGNFAAPLDIVGERTLGMVEGQSDSANRHPVLQTKHPHRPGLESTPSKERASTAPMASRDPSLDVELGRIGGQADFGQPEGSPSFLFEPEIISSIIAGNLNDGSLDPDLDLTPSPDRDTNLMVQNSVIGFADPGGSPFLAPLADNNCFEIAGAAVDPGAGCPKTHRLLAVNTGVTIDQGLNVFELEFDQRGSGFARVIGEAIDIGAYEFQPLGIGNFSISSDLLRQGETLNVFWNVLPDQEVVSCFGSGLPGTVWDELALENNGELLIDTSGLLPGEYFVALECQRDAELAFLEIPLQVLEPIEVSLELVPDTVPLGDLATISWDAVPNDSATTCSAESTPPVAVWTGPLINSGSLEIDSGQILPGTYQLSLLCTRNEFSATAAVELTVTDEPLEILLAVSASVVVVGDEVVIEWTASPDDEFSSCTGFGLDGTDWNAARETSGSFLLETVSLAPGTFDVGLECSRPGQTESATVPLVIEPLELNLALDPPSLIRGDNLTISWTGTEGAVCTGSGLPGTTWNGVGKPASGQEVVRTAPLPAGDYLVGLICERAGLTIEREVPVMIQPLELSLSVAPTALVRGDDLTISWTGTEGAVCTGSGLPGTTWNGVGKPASGQEVVRTAPLPAGDYLVGLICERAGLTIEREVPVMIQPLELSLLVAPTALVRGDDLTISWTGTEGAVCTGSGLPGTTWNGVGKPASGQEVVSTAPLPAGDYLVGLTALVRGDDLTISWTGTEGAVCTGSGLPGLTIEHGAVAGRLICERAGLTIEREAPATIQPLELSLSVAPTALVRGDDLTISWTGTEGAVCTGSGLPGTDWNGGGKVASGTQVVNSEALEPNTYQVRLTCERQGVAIQREGELIVLARPADLALSAAIVDMGIAGSDFVEFSISNTSQNPAFDLAFEIAAPAAYQIAGLFIRAPECNISGEESNQVNCDLEAIGDWQCESADGTTICGLAELPANGATGVVIELRGQGATSVSGTVEASNADARVAEIGIGSGEAP